MPLKNLLGAALLAVVAIAAEAHDYKAGAITIDHPHARATAPGQPIGGAYMVIVNRGATPDRLVGASADVSKSVEIHTMAMDGDVMRMRQVDGVDLKPGETVEFKSGAYHVMLVGLKAPLRPGTRFPMQLTFEKAGPVTVEVVVDGTGAGAEPAHSADHGAGMKH